MQYFLVLTLLASPAYALRFNLSAIPTNLLMLWVFFFWLVFFLWLAMKNQLSEFFKSILKINKKNLGLIPAFFISGVISLFVQGADISKLGQLIVLFLQPISLFFISKFIFEQYPKSRSLILNAIYITLAAAGLYAILQYLTLIGLPQAYWGNADEPKRAVSFFSHPNFYALWSAPLLALLIPDVFESLKTKTQYLKPFLWLLGALGLLLSFSRSGWIGLAAAIGVYTIVAADTKIRKLILSAAVIVIIIIAAVPNLRWRFILPFYGEKSAVSRLSLWNTGWKGIKESPITGLGLTGFSQNWQRLNTDPNLNSHNFPHNIFLNFWVETGLLGLISFICIAGLTIYKGIKNRQNMLALGVALFIIAMIFQGLLDNSYFKNDLAMIFWLALALSLDAKGKSV